MHIRRIVAIFLSHIERRPRLLLAHRSQLTQLQTNKTSLHEGGRTEGATNTNRSSVTTCAVLAALFLRVQVVRGGSLLHWVSVGRRYEGSLLSSVRAQDPWRWKRHLPPKRHDFTCRQNRTLISIDISNALSCSITAVKLGGGTGPTPVISAPFSTSIDSSNVVTSTSLILRYKSDRIPFPCIAAAALKLENCTYGRLFVLCGKLKGNMWVMCRAKCEWCVG